MIAEGIKEILESMPNPIFPLASFIASHAHPWMKKITVIPHDEEKWKVFTKKNVFLAPDKLSTLWFSYPRPFEGWLKIEKGDVVLEGGATIGEDTYRIAEKVGEEGKVIAVEPNPENTKYLRINMKKYKNVKIIQKGLGEKESFLDFSLKERRGGSLFSEKGDSENSEKEIKVQVDSIDNITRGEKIDAIKMNVEGAEIEAIKGAEETLDKCKRVLIAAHHSREGVVTADKVISMLESKGFTATLLHGICAQYYVLGKKN